MAAPRSPVRLVAFDLDGTLIGRDVLLRPRVLETVAAMRAAGIAGCIVTGRMYRAAVPYVRALGFEAPMICYQGAAIFDPASGTVMREVALEAPVVRTLIETARGDGKHLQLYRDDRYYCEARNEYAALYAQLSGVEPIVVRSLLETFSESGATKAVIVDDAASAERYLPRVRQAVGDDGYVTRSYPEFIEVINPQVDKGRALTDVAAWLGITMENVVAIGDSWNDEPLLQAAGLGIAMGNAPAELREHAAAVVGTVEEDGVAEALERYVLA